MILTLKAAEVSVLDSSPCRKEMKAQRSLNPGTVLTAGLPRATDLGSTGSTGAHQASCQKIGQCPAEKLITLQ